MCKKTPNKGAKNHKKNVKKCKKKGQKNPCILKILVTKICVSRNFMDQIQNRVSSKSGGIHRGCISQGLAVFLTAFFDHCITFLHSENTVPSITKLDKIEYFGLSKKAAVITNFLLIGKMHSQIQAQSSPLYQELHLQIQNS